VIDVTLQGAQAALATAVEELWSAVTELTVIAQEDRPLSDGLAVADDLAEQASELQGEVAAVRNAVRTNGADLTFARLPEVQAELDAAARRYWQRIRAYDSVANLRRAVLRRGAEWTAWQRSVDQSARRCAEPLAASVAALNTCWQEVCQLLTVAAASHPAGPPPSDEHRRMP
jgi:hypothetical protein